MITKAVLACGGWSTRFLPTVKTYAKQLLPIYDRPQIHWVLEELIAAGIKEVVIIHRENENSLIKHLTPDSELESYLSRNNKQVYLEGWKNITDSLKISFIPQTSQLPYGNGSPILFAQDFIGNDPFIYLYADDLIIEDIPGSFTKSLISVFEQYQADAVCAAKQVSPQQIKFLSSVKYKDGHIPYRIDTVIEKPEPEVAPSLNCIFGRFVFSPAIISTLKNTPVARGELWLTDAVNLLAQQKVAIAQPLIPGSDWITTGDPQNWLKANITVALKDEKHRQDIENFLKSL